jgi:hypothetical protein
LKVGVSALANLSDIELDVIFFIERFAATNGNVPTRVQIEQRFNGLDDNWFANFDANPLVLKSFRTRGIVYPAQSDALTDDQMHAIATMLDPYDRRSDEKKLRDLGLTSRQWATWLLDDQFAEYVRDRSERMLQNSVHEAHKGLIKSARNGNIAGAKMLYEITGRYRPDEEQQVDVRRVLHTFIEVIQKYVKDPVVLHNIAMDLSNAASAESLSTGLSNQMLSGAQNFRQRTIAGQAQVVPVPAGIEGLDE